MDTRCYGGELRQVTAAAAKAELITRMDPSCYRGESRSAQQQSTNGLAMALVSGNDFILLSFSQSRSEHTNTNGREFHEYWQNKEKDESIGSTVGKEKGEEANKRTKGFGSISISTLCSRGMC